MHVLSNSGEIAWDKMTHPFTWAKNPMLNRVNLLEGKLPVSFIFGKRTWMDTSVGEKTRIIRGEDCYTRTEFISGAGHHVYANNSEAFNEEVEKILTKVEKGEDLHGCPPGLNVRF